MIDEFGYESPLGESNPYTAGVRRRAAPVSLADYQAQPTPEDTTSGFGKRARRSAENFRAGIDAIRALGNKLIGDDELAQQQAEQSLARQAEAQRIGPDIQSLEDAQAAGGGVTDYLEAAATMAVDMAPDAMLSLVGGGLAGALAKKVAVSAARGVARREATRMVDATDIARRAAAGLPRASADTARLAPGGVIARREAIEAATPRFMPPVSQRGQRVATYVGTAAGEAPGINRENAEMLADPNLSRGDAAKLAAGTAAASLIGGAPEAALLLRYGGKQAVQETGALAQRYLARIGKAGALQAGAEGTAEAAQQATILASQKWAGKNIDLVGDEAVDSYVMSFFGGALLGGVLGSGVEGGKVGGELAGKALDASKPAVRKLYAALRRNLSLRRRTVPDGPAAAPGPAVGDEIGPGGPDGAPTPASALYERARGAARGVGDALGGLADRFRANRNKVGEIDDIDEETAATINEMLRSMSPNDPATVEDLGINVDTMRPSTSPLDERAALLGMKLNSTALRVAARVIPDKSPMWTDVEPKKLAGYVRSTAKMLEGKPLNDDDKARLDELRAEFPKRLAAFEVSNIKSADLDAIDADDDTPMAGVRNEVARALTAEERAARDLDATVEEVDTDDAVSVDGDYGLNTRTEPVRDDLQSDALAPVADADNLSNLQRTVEGLQSELSAAREAAKSLEQDTARVAELEAAEQTEPVKRELLALKQNIGRAQNVSALERALVEADDTGREIKRRVLETLRGRPTPKMPYGNSVFALTSDNPETLKKLLDNPARIAVVGDPLGIEGDIRAAQDKFADKDGVPLQEQIDNVRSLIEDAGGPDVAPKKLVARLKGLETEAAKRASKKYRYALDISTLMARWRGKNPGSTIKQAVAGALGDAVLAGVQFDTDTITPGDIKSKDGDVIMRIVPDGEFFPKNDPRAIKLQTLKNTVDALLSKKPPKPARPRKPVSPKRAKKAEKAWREKGKAKADVSGYREEEARGASQDAEPLSDREAAGRLAPRETPKGTTSQGTSGALSGERGERGPAPPEARATAFVPTMSPVLDSTTGARNAPPDADKVGGDENKALRDKARKRMYDAARELVGDDLRMTLEDGRRTAFDNTLVGLIERLPQSNDPVVQELLLAAEQYVDGESLNDARQRGGEPHPIAAALDRRREHLKNMEAAEAAFVDRAGQPVTDAQVAESVQRVDAATAVVERTKRLYDAARDEAHAAAMERERATEARDRASQALQDASLLLRYAKDAARSDGETLSPEAQRERLQAARESARTETLQKAAADGASPEETRKRLTAALRSVEQSMAPAGIAERKRGNASALAAAEAKHASAETSLKAAETALDAAVTKAAAAMKKSAAAKKTHAAALKNLAGVEAVSLKVRAGTRDVDVASVNAALEAKGKNAARLDSAFARIVGRASYWVREQLGLDPLDVFDGIMAMSQTKTTAAASTTTVDGRPMLLLDTGRLSGPHKPWGDRDQQDRLLRVLAHETTHGLDHMHRAKTGQYLSDDAAFADDGPVWKELNAVKNPLLKSWFEYITAGDFKGSKSRELFAQIGALRARFPELLDDLETTNAAFEAALDRAAGRTPAQAPARAEADAGTVEGPSDGNRAAVESVAAAAVPPVLPPAGGGTPPVPFEPPSFRAVMRFVKKYLRPAERQVLERVLNREDIYPILRNVYAHDEKALVALDSGGVGLEAKIALAYIAWANGKIDAGPKGNRAFNTVLDDALHALRAVGDSDVAQQIFTDMKSGHIEAMRRAQRDYDARHRAAMREHGRISGVQMAINTFGNVVDAVFEPLSKVMQSSVERARAWGVPAANRILAKLYVTTGQSDATRSLSREVVHDTAIAMRTASRILDGLSRRDQYRVMRLLQVQAKRGDPNRVASNEVWNAVNDLRTFMSDLFDRMQDAGVKIDRIENYWPVQMDLRNEKAVATLRTLLSQPKYEAAIREHFKDQKGKRPINELVDMLVEGAQRDPDILAETSADAPGFNALRHRVFDFIYKQGDRGDIDTLASLQLKDPAESLARYVEPAIKRMAYARRFGDDGAVLKRHLDEMKAQGATPAQIEEMRNIVAAEMGTYGHDGSPVLKLLSSSLADKVKGRKTLTAIQALQAYQNVRVLPLATIASLVDPMAIAVRTGGDFKTAWQGFRDGFRTLYDPKARQEANELLAFLGSTDELHSMTSLGGLYGGDKTPLARKVNDTLFRINGLAAWTRTTRYMALSAANRFIAKHARGVSDQSKRYLVELGLRDGDVTIDPNGNVMLRTGDAAKDARVQQALMRFVDESILRPNTVQRPLWHNDPYMGLITQYKAFAYAIWDTVGGRIGRETRAGNPMVVLPALMYAPAVIGAELIRELIQFGPEGDERRKDWGPQDYLMLGWERSNVFFSPMVRAAYDAGQDVSRDRLAGSSLIGPTLSQGRGLYDALSGRRDPLKTFEEALPASAMWKRWNDDGLWDNTVVGMIQEQVDQAPQALDDLEATYRTISNWRLL